MIYKFVSNLKKIMKLYYYNKKTLGYERLPIGIRVRNLISIIILLLCTFLYGQYYKQDRVKLIFVQNELTIGSDEWKDSIFNDYMIRATVYLDNYPDSPIEPGMLTLAAHNSYDSTGILLPVEFALAQAQLESSLGTKGRSPVNNPYNVGEFDTHTVMWFDSTFEGIQAYYYLMCRDYLKCKSTHTLFKNFTNCNGFRYASSPTYEQSMSRQVAYIKKYIDNVLYTKEDKGNE